MEQREKIERESSQQGLWVETARDEKALGGLEREDAERDRKREREREKSRDAETRVHRSHQEHPALPLSVPVSGVILSRALSLSLACREGAARRGRVLDWSSRAGDSCCSTTFSLERKGQTLRQTRAGACSCAEKSVAGLSRAGGCDSHQHDLAGLYRHRLKLQGSPPNLC